MPAIGRLWPSDDNDNVENADNFAWKKDSFGPLFVFVYQNISMSTFPISAHLRERAIVVNGYEHCDTVDRANCDIVDDDHWYYWRLASRYCMIILANLYDSVDDDHYDAV